MSKPVVAAFDFDGTLSRGTSGLRFIHHVLNPARLARFYATQGLNLFQYQFRINDEACFDRINRSIFAGMLEREVESAARVFAVDKMAAYLMPDAIAVVQRYLDQGARCILVSRGYGLYLRHWVATFNPPLELIATEMEVVAGRLTGAMVGISCDSREKPRRLLQVIPDRGAVELHAYGDSVGDHAMFAIADRAFLRVGGTFVEQGAGR